ncbi:hypothetical protein ACTXT7_007682 [Hymenolepis weldensis]
MSAKLQPKAVKISRSAVQLRDGYKGCILCASFQPSSSLSGLSCPFTCLGATP